MKKISLLILTCLSMFSLNAAEISGNFALTNDYIWRGMSQTGEDFAYSGGVDVSAENNGSYIGVWGSKVDFGADDDTNMEVDVYFGYSDESARGVSFDVGYISYSYPGSSELNFEEIYFGFGYKLLGLNFAQGLDGAPDNMEMSLALGESGFNFTYGEYDDYGKYEMLSYDFPVQIANRVSVGIGLSNFDSEDGMADEDGFVITFSM